MWKAFAVRRARRASEDDGRRQESRMKAVTPRLLRSALDHLVVKWGQSEAFVLERERIGDHMGSRIRVTRRILTNRGWQNDGRITVPASLIDWGRAALTQAISQCMSKGSGQSNR
jgi:hypothetical protein